MTRLLTLVFAFVALRIADAAEVYPNFVHNCPADMPLPEKCFVQTISALMPFFAKGFEPLQLPPMQPMAVNDFLVLPKSSGIQIAMTDVHIYNLYNMTITDFQILDYGRHFKFVAHYPHNYAKYKYNIDGELLFLPIKATGDGEGHFYNVVAQNDIQLDHVPNANGVMQPVVKKIKATTVIERGSIKIGNLPSRVLTEALNSMMNDNFKEFSKDIVPMLEKRSGQRLRIYINQLFAHFTSEQLFPGVKLD